VYYSELFHTRVHLYTPDTDSRHTNNEEETQLALYQFIQFLFHQKQRDKTAHNIDIEQISTKLINEAEVSKRQGK